MLAGHFASSIRIRTIRMPVPRTKQRRPIRQVDVRNKSRRNGASPSAGWLLAPALNRIA
jgi:hypothetical protein